MNEDDDDDLDFDDDDLDDDNDDVNPDDSQMSYNQITVKFGGDGNIKVETLTEFLRGYKDLLHLINTELGYAPNDLIIEVSPPENGSFKIKLAPKYQNVLLNAAAGLVVSTLSGVLVYHMTKPSSTSDINTVEEILKKNDLTEKNLSKNVYNVYHNSGAHQTINQTFITVNGDGNITDLNIKRDDKEIIDVKKEQLTELISTDSESTFEEPAKEDILTDEAVLVIKTIHFEGQGKWAFIFRGYPIRAIIKDEKFLSKLNNEPFTKGDTLKVLLSRKRTFDEELQTYLVDQTSYVIEEVLEHKSKLDEKKNQLGF
ncbi:MAG: hypothetical protein ABJH98_20075 [Reichenbachiella sp.]|uniref:hypothetical protein n=1 Tax=Reichenbachiella sp. TaxID=2184521 RepID=UPI003297DBD1